MDLYIFWMLDLFVAFAGIKVFVGFSKVGFPYLSRMLEAMPKSCTKAYTDGIAMKQTNFVQRLAAGLERKDLDRKIAYTFCAEKHFLFNYIVFFCFCFFKRRPLPVGGRGRLTSVTPRPPPPHL